MASIVWWIIILAVLAAVAAGTAVLFKAYASGSSPRDVFFKPRIDPRIAVVEHANVDGKRRLILIRRDDVEHLIMTGGPVDVVIETGIGDQPARPADARAVEVAPSASNATVFTRAPRTFGQAAPAVVSDEPDVALKR